MVDEHMGCIAAEKRQVCFISHCERLSYVPQASSHFPHPTTSLALVRNPLPIPAQIRLPRGQTPKSHRRKRHRPSRTWRTRWKVVVVAVPLPRAKAALPVGSILSVAKEDRCGNAAVVGACPRQREVAFDVSQFNLLGVMYHWHRPRNVDERLARALATTTMVDVDARGSAVFQAVIPLP